ncbi:hypothetical protein GJ20_gp08 [Lactococcus phage P092]|uniref:Uncharacterized protein n=1 Tax=Lactococcus phage P092 TaxID=1476887 RepID=X4YWC6_9CAUD|nr:hypothetical protein GJ20_gp08 [Lactococcus phage P092]AHV83049.1 hypothetical protein P092_008 [Lactococcus phage P092]
MERTEVIVHSIVSDPNDLQHSEYLGSGRDVFGNLVHIYDVDNDQLIHYGTVGMKWGKRRAYNKAISSAVDHQDRANNSAEYAKVTSKKATKANNKLDKKIAKGKGNSKSAQRAKRKMDKYNDLTKSHTESHEVNTRKANEYIAKAAKLGRSKDTPFRDIAKQFINGVGNDLNNPSQVVANAKSQMYAERQEKRNAAAKKANALRDKNKG